MPEDFRRLQVRLDKNVDSQDAKRMRWLDKTCRRHGQFTALVRRMIDTCMALEKNGQFKP